MSESLGFLPELINLCVDLFTIIEDSRGSANMLETNVHRTILYLMKICSNLLLDNGVFSNNLASLMTANKFHIKECLKKLVQIFKNSNEQNENYFGSFKVRFTFHVRF